MNKKEKQAGPEICFVVSPIGSAESEARVHANWVLDGIIKPVFAEHYPDIEVQRSDKISIPGQINAQVIERLLTAKIVIADLSLLNPNVFYEIGVRHMAQMPIIHIQLEDESVPFDNSIYRTVKFSLRRQSDIELAKIQLSEQLKIALSPDYEVDNPVIETQGRIKLRENYTPAQLIINNQLDELKSKVQELQSIVNSRVVDERNSSRSSSYSILRANSPQFAEREFMTIRSADAEILPDTLVQAINDYALKHRRIRVSFSSGMTSGTIEGQLKAMYDFKDFIFSRPELIDGSVLLKNQSAEMVLERS